MDADSGGSSQCQRWPPGMEYCTVEGCRIDLYLVI